MGSVPEKRCKTCGETKPLNEQNFKRGKTYAGGWRPRCRECLNAEGRRYAREHAEENAARSKAWREVNREWVRQRTAANQKVKQPSRTLVQRARREATRELVREKARAAYRARPEKFRNYQHRRRAHKLAAEGMHSADDVLKQYGAQQGRCWWCFAELGSNYHVDHRIPLSRGGSDGPENIVCACAHCNQTKNAKLPHEWNGRLL